MPSYYNNKQRCCAFNSGFVEGAIVLNSLLTVGREHHLLRSSLDDESLKIYISEKKEKVRRRGFWGYAKALNTAYCHRINSSNPYLLYAPFDN